MDDHKHVVVRSNKKLEKLFWFLFDIVGVMLGLCLIVMLGIILVLMLGFVIYLLGEL